MGYPINLGNTNQLLQFLLVSSSDHITGVPGLTPTVKINKNNTSWVVPSGAVVELGGSGNGFGWYAIEPNATDANTLGPIALHAFGPGTDPTDQEFPVVGYNPWGLNLAADGLNAILVEAGIVASGALTDDNGDQLTTLTFPQAMALLAAMAAASTNGAAIGNSSIQFKAVGQPGITRIQGNVDIFGNRNSMVVRVPVAPP